MICLIDEWKKGKFAVSMQDSVVHAADESKVEVQVLNDYIGKPPIQRKVV